MRQMIPITRAIMNNFVVDEMKLSINGFTASAASCDPAGINDCTLFKTKIGSDVMTRFHPTPWNLPGNVSIETNNINSPTADNIQAYVIAVL